MRSTTDADLAREPVHGSASCGTARRDQLGELISGFQAVAQGYLARKRYRRAHGKEDAIRAIQRNALVFIDLHTWPWWKL